MKTYHEVIDETVAYYSKNPRALTFNDSGGKMGCAYLSKEGNMCAVGRVFNQQSLDVYGGSGSHFMVLVSDYDLPFTNLFKEEYQHLDDLDFWDTLQLLHDCDDYWNGNTLTKEGQNKVEEMKLEFK